MLFPEQMVMNMSLAWRLNFPSQLGQEGHSYLGKHSVETEMAKKPLMPHSAPGYTCNSIQIFISIP